MKWCVGVTTSPRENASYLGQTIESLQRAGWSKCTIFAEPGSFIPSADLTVVYRPKVYGDWTNWATGLYELLLSNPDSDYFFMIEDDVVFATNIRKYLEYAIPKLGAFGSLSLYTPSIYHRFNYKGFHHEIHQEKTWSTVTVIMHRDSVIRFFSDPQVQNHRFFDTFGKGQEFWCCPHTDFKNSIKDAVLGRWAYQNNLPVFYHTPSLAEHIGHVSTLNDDAASKANGRKSFDFVGESTDLSSWVNNPVFKRKFNQITLS